jgi:hypothetical protein
MVSLEQQIKWADAVQQFSNEVYAKYPGLGNSWTPALIEEVKAIGLFKEFISPRSLWACFRNCVADNRIALPPTEPALTPEQIDRLRAKFPPVIKKVERELSQREKSAMVGVSPQSGRLTAADRQAATKEVDSVYNSARNNARLNRLRQEYRDLKANAETLRGENARSHAQAYAARKEALEKINADPRFAEVRD